MTPYALELRESLSLWLPKDLPQHSYIVDPFVGMFDSPDGERLPTPGVLLKVPIKRFHDAWLPTQQGQCFLAGDFGDCDVMKLIRAARYLAHARDGVWAPTLSRVHSGDSFVIVQGRHRFMFHWLAGYEYIDVAVNPLHLQYFDGLF